jgi:L-alanine-DL-glutamate epimerase-like enolase superfamily enzyme
VASVSADTAIPPTESSAGHRIVAVEAIPYSAPLRRPGRFASGTIAAADNVLVRVRSDSGLVGQAEAQPRPYTYGETQASIVAAVRDELGPRLLGMDALRTERTEARCAEVDGHRVARGAVDLAVWDLVGKALELPCATLLGGFADDVKVAYMVSFDEPSAMAHDARAVHEELGVTAFKLKVGRDPELDVACVRAVRESLPEAELYVDANRGWASDDALRAGAGLLELGVVAIEEPIDVADRAGRLRLAQAWAPVPLVADESAISLAHVGRALDEGAVGMVSVKTARTGFTESRRILDLCSGRGVPARIGSQYEGALGALATLHFAAAHAAVAQHPAELANFTDLADDLVASPPVVRAGRAAVPARPGLGAEIDEERLARYRLDG